MHIMRSIACLFVALFLLTPFTAHAQTGSLQVTSIPGVRVYVDDQFMGVTNDIDNGLFIEGLAPGEHMLKAVITGSEPLELVVDILEDQAVEALVDFPEEAVPEPEPEPEVEPAPEPEKKTVVPNPRTSVGTFVLSSDPVGATIYIDGEYKGSADIVVDNREAGRYTIVFQMGKQKLTGTFILRPREVLKLKANFVYEDIVNITEQERRRRTNRYFYYPAQ